MYCGCGFSIFASSLNVLDSYCLIPQCSQVLHTKFIRRGGGYLVPSVVLKCEARPPRAHSRRGAPPIMSLLTNACRCSVSYGVGCPPQAFPVDIRRLRSALTFPYVLVFLRVDVFAWVCSEISRVSPFARTGALSQLCDCANSCHGNGNRKRFQKVGRPYVA